MYKSLNINQSQKASLWDISLELILDVDSSGKIISCQPSDENLLGYEENEIIGRQIFEFLEDTYQSEIAEYLHNNVKKNVSLDLELKVKHKKGEYIPLNLNISTYFIDQNKQFMVIFSHIASLQQQNLNLDEKIEFYDLISDKSSDTVILLLKNNDIVYVSESVKNVLGYAPKEASKFNLLKHFHPEDLYRLRKNDFKSSSQNPNHFIQTFRYKHKSGHYIWVEA